MKFAVSPNLPNCCKAVIIGEKYAKKLSEKLSDYDVNILPVPDNPYVDIRLSGHADLSVLHIGGEKLVLAPFLKGSVFSQKLAEYGARVYYADLEQRAEYPYDSQLNVCLIGDKLICSKFYEKSNLVNFLTNGYKLKMFSSRQGYVKCSMCVVNENAFITADPSLYRIGSSCGMDVLQIRPGFIKLDGFDYGFIGGAAFKLSEKQIAFTGHLNEHPDKKSILDFLSLHNVDPVYLTDAPAFDIGSALPLLEK